MRMMVFVALLGLGAASCAPETEAARAAREAEARYGADWAVTCSSCVHGAPSGCYADRRGPGDLVARVDVGACR